MSGPPAWGGGRVDDTAECVLARNPGAMTLDGTNTWVLAAPGARGAVVVDPGPLDDAHLHAVLATAQRGGRRVEWVLLTHGHPDHAEGAVRFAGLAGAAVRAADPGRCLRAPALVDEEVVEAGGLRLGVLATPGHTGDSVCLEVTPGPGAAAVLLTGDTVLGRGTSVVAHPDGVLADYLDSLARLRDRVAGVAVRRLLPGHGPVLDDPAGVLDGYLAHRQGRLAQVRAALATGARTAEEVVDAVYAGVDPAVRAAAEQSVRAQLEYLAHSGGSRRPR